jgi:H+/gluconate symporter-like permease
MKLIAGLVLTVVTITIFIYLVLKAESKRKRQIEQKHLAQSYHKSKRAQELRDFGFVSAKSQRRI